MAEGLGGKAAMLQAFLTTSNPSISNFSNEGNEHSRGLRARGPASGFTGVTSITLCTAHKDSSKSVPTVLIRRSLETQGQRPRLSQCVSRSSFVNAAQMFLFRNSHHGINEALSFF